MHQYKEDFIKFMVRSKVLTFGDFMTKSGRKTPFFINTGNYDMGSQLEQLGLFYAQAIKASFDLEGAPIVLFGPAYKGIPLVTTASIALNSKFGDDIAVCFNRKEQKNHGEGGNIIGHRLKDGDRVIIVEDVTTAGTSIRETVPLLKAAADIKLAGLIVSVDRMECVKEKVNFKSALVSLAQEFSMVTTAIVTLDDIITHLHNNKIDGTVHIDDDIKNKIDDYRTMYGAEY